MNDKDAILAANAAYYRALQTAKLMEMSRIWADDGISCIHPGWSILVGRQPVMESYRDILNDPGREWIEYCNDTALISGDEGRVFCVEIVDGVALATTNWFRRIGGTWRMIHHQASPIAGLAEARAPSSSRQLN
jgi:hypothetical protein